MPEGSLSGANDSIRQSGHMSIGYDFVDGVSGTVATESPHIVSVQYGARSRLLTHDRDHRGTTAVVFFH